MEAVVDEQAGSRSGAPPRPARHGPDEVLERGPGVHVVADPTPARAGRALAAALGADLAVTATAAEQAIRERLGNRWAASALDEVIDLREGVGGSGELSAPSSDDRAGRLLAERLAAHDAATPTRTLVIAHVAHLRLLAAAVDRAERVRARTEDGALEGLGGSAGRGRGDPGPAAGRASAGQAVPDLRFDALELTPPPHGGTTLEQVKPAEPTDRTTTGDGSSADSALIAGGVLLLSVALAGAILLTSLPPVLAIAPILLGLFVAALIRRTTPIGADPFILAAPSAGPGATQGGGVSISAPTARELLQSGASTEQTSAVERSAIAPEPTGERPETPSGDDPRDVIVPLAADTAAVRAATRFASDASQAWETAWTELGMHPPATATAGPNLDAALADLEQRIEAGETPPVVAGDHSDATPADRAPSAELRRRLAKLLAGRSLEAVIDAEPGPPPIAPAPLVLVEPFVGLDAARREAMRSGLEALGLHHEVIVILQTGSDSPLDLGA